MQTLWWWIILGLVALGLVDATSDELTVKISQRKTRSGHQFGFFVLPARSVEELVALVLEDFEHVEYDFVDMPVLDSREHIAGSGPSTSHVSQVGSSSERLRSTTPETSEWESSSESTSHSSTPGPSTEQAMKA
ncbi:hypothetical protein F5878DRAFT_664585 [Lentinula raphanica]|uniref:Uncharacterized protein n=1 Tax=Lentinula raphanica TaxID=153919 RepID=A0AA38P1P9_9AGAR|nr:hypothetical protein F5878DRAFT_664585 [Lentinula raphanica]